MRTEESPEHLRVSNQIVELVERLCCAALVYFAQPDFVLQPRAEVEKGDDDLE